MNAIVSFAKEVSMHAGRGKELEENGFGVVLDKKRAKPLRAAPWWSGLVVAVTE